MERSIDGFLAKQASNRRQEMGRRTEVTWLFAGVMMVFQGATGASIANPDGAMSAAANAMTINLALKDGRFYLGEVCTRIVGDTPLSVERDGFLKAAAPVLRPGVAEELRNLPAEGDFLSFASLKAAGLPVEFDLGQMTLSVNPAIEQRPKGHISLAAGEEPAQTNQFSKQSAVSGYMNVNAAAQFTGKSLTGRASSAETVGTASAIRVLNVVFENEATYANGAITRQGTRAIYDDPSKALRYSFGDLSPAYVGLQGGSSILGVAVEKSYAKLQPQKNIRPLGGRSFRLERPSEVDVVVNGQLVRRLQMPPGDHDISELPLRPGENVLKLEITGDTGLHTTLEFRVFFDHTLLAPGIDEWGAAAGFVSTAGFSGLTYNWMHPTATAYYRSGLTESLTGTAHVQADNNAIMAGAMGTAQTSFGLVSAEAAASVRWDGVPGVAGSLTYTPETLLKAFELPGMAQLAINLRSAAFSPILAAAASAGTYSLNGFYSVPLPDDYTLALSANGSVGAKPGFGGGVTLAKSLQPDLSLGVSASYQSEPAVSGVPDAPDWSVVARVSVKLGDDSEVSYSVDKASGKTQAELSTQGRSADGSYGLKALLENDPGNASGTPPEELATLNANYSGQRFDIGASYSRQDLQRGGTLGSVSTISGAGAIAFADNHWALGHPVTDSFAIVTPHPSIEDATIQVAPGEKGARGISGLLGDALVSDLASYSPGQLPVRVDGAPEGYDLGSGLFEVRPSYRSGYVLQVGSDYSVTAIGILEDEGKPLALLSGLAKESGGSEGRKVAVFTNGEGRFAADGLKPGLWRLEVLSEPPACFALAIPSGTAGLFDAGKLNQRCAS
jgi:outer membrane usher protein